MSNNYSNIKESNIITPNSILIDNNIDVYKNNKYNNNIDVKYTKLYNFNRESSNYKIKQNNTHKSKLDLKQLSNSDLNNSNNSINFNFETNNNTNNLNSNDKKSYSYNNINSKCFNSNNNSNNNLTNNTYNITSDKVHSNKYENNLDNLKQAQNLNISSNSFLTNNNNSIFNENKDYKTNNKEQLKQIISVTEIIESLQKKLKPLTKSGNGNIKSNFFGDKKNELDILNKKIKINTSKKESIITKLSCLFPIEKIEELKNTNSLKEDSLKKLNEEIKTLNNLITKQNNHKKDLEEISKKETVEYSLYSEYVEAREEYSKLNNTKINLETDLRKLINEVLSNSNKRKSIISRILIYKSIDNTNINKDNDKNIMNIKNKINYDFEKMFNYIKLTSIEYSKDIDVLNNNCKHLEKDIEVIKDNIFEENNLNNKEIQTLKNELKALEKVKKEMFNEYRLKKNIINYKTRNNSYNKYSNIKDINNILNKATDRSKSKNYDKHCSLDRSNYSYKNKENNIDININKNELFSLNNNVLTLGSNFAKNNTYDTNNSNKKTNTENIKEINNKTVSICESKNLTLSSKVKYCKNYDIVDNKEYNNSIYINSTKYKLNNYSKNYKLTYTKPPKFGINDINQKSRNSECNNLKIPKLDTFNTNNNNNKNIDSLNCKNRLNTYENINYNKEEMLINKSYLPTINN